MKKKVMWLFPSLFLACCLMVNIVLDKYEISLDLVDFVMYIIAIYGTLLVAPCFYLGLIKVYSSNIKSLLCHILCAFGCVVLNAIIVCYESLLCYFRIKERGGHDLDLLPMYIVVPSVVILIGANIILIKLRK